MNRARLLFVFSLLISLVMLCSTLALAQFQAGLQGTVLDNSGAVVSGAKVAATEDATGVSHTATSSSSGFYRISELPPGTYTVIVEASGFKKSSTAGVVIRAELLRGLDVTVQLGQAQETVNVTEQTQALETEDATISGTLSAAEVENLPALDRDPYELIRLAPGIFGDGARAGNGTSMGFPNGPSPGTGTGSSGPGGSNTAIFQVENQQPISANGQRVTSNDYMVDGVSVNSLEWGGAAVITPSIETVQELTVLSSDYDASDGRSSGAHIKTVTKSGANALHGGGLFLYHDPNFNAYNKFGGYQAGSVPGSGLLLSPVRYDDSLRQFAGTVGGPIIKNKLFFFFNYEGARDRLTTFENNWVETPQYDAAILGLRSGTDVGTIFAQSGLAPRIVKLYTPTCAVVSPPDTCNVVGTGIDVGSPIGPYGTYDPTSQFQNGFGGGLDGVPDLELAQIALPESTQGKQYNIRVDYNHGKDLFSVSTFLTYLTHIAADSQAQGRPSADFGTKAFSPSGFFSWVRTISPTMLNEARFNFTRYGYNGITSNPQANFAFPRIEIQGYNFPGSQRIRFNDVQGDTSPAIVAQNTFAFRDVLSKVMGNKALKFGFEFSREQDNDALIGGARPDQVFQGLWNLANGTPIFEVIEVNPITGGPPSTKPTYFRSSDYGVFAQNDWKVRPNLTINLGLRWEYFTPPTEAKGHLTNFIPSNDPVNGLVNGKEVNPSRQWNPTWRNFGPRLGFAWAPTMYDNKLVFRGGAGIAYDSLDNNIVDQTRNNPPYVANYGLCCGTSNSPFAGGTIVFDLGTSNNPLSYPANPVLAVPLGPNGLPELTGQYSSVSIYADPVHMPIPYTYLYSLQFQYSMPKDWVFTMGYQGSTGHHLTRVANLNYFYPTQNPGLNSIYSFRPDTNSSYNALITQLEHRFHHGVSANVLYTYSKSIDQSSAEGPGYTTNQTFPGDDHTERGPSDYDATHNFRAVGLWELPVFHARNNLLGKVLGGWALNGIFQFHSGFPWTPVANNVCPVLGTSGLCPLRPIAYNGQAGNNHQTSAFLPPTSSNFPALNGLPMNAQNPYFTLQTSGNSPDFPGIGRNSFRSPRYQDIDLTVLKEFGLPSMKYLGEGAKIQLRLSAYNAFNKLNLAPFQFGSQSTLINVKAGDPAYSPYFGTASLGLAGRTVELQARFSF